MELRVGTRLWNYVQLFWNSLDNAPSSIVFYLEMKVEVEVGVHDIRSWFTPRPKLMRYKLEIIKLYVLISPKIKNSIKI